MFTPKFGEMIQFDEHISFKGVESANQEGFLRLLGKPLQGTERSHNISHRFRDVGKIIDSKWPEIRGYVSSQEGKSHGCQPKNRGVSPQIIYFNRVFHNKPSILGYLFLETPTCYFEMATNKVTLGFVSSWDNSPFLLWMKPRINPPLLIRMVDDGT